MLGFLQTPFQKGRMPETLSSVRLPLIHLCALKDKRPTEELYTPDDREVL